MHVVAMQTLAAGIADGETDGPKQAALGAAARGAHLSTLAYSERGSRSHFWAQVSRARAQDGEVVIDADKSWATSAGEADSYVLACGAAGADDPLTTELYFVSADAAGLEVAAPFDGLGMRANASAPLRVRDLRVTLDRRLGPPGGGFGLMMQATLPWFVLGSAACSVGIAGAALDAAIGHVQGARLEHLGSGRADVPGVRARLAEGKVRHAQARAYLYEFPRGNEVARELLLRVGAGIDLRERAELRVHPKRRSTRLAVHLGSPFFRQRPSNDCAAGDVGFHSVPMSRRFTKKSLVSVSGHLVNTLQSP